MMGPNRDGNSTMNERPRACWNRGIQNELSRTNLLDLASGNIPAINIPCFIEEVTADSLRRIHGGLERGYYKNVVPPITKFGPAVFEYEFADRKDYFSRAKATDELLSSLMKGVLSPLLRFQQRLQELCDLSADIAVDGSHGRYFAGTLRSIEQGTPVHIDFAPHESSPWEMISSVEAQLAANLYLDTPLDKGNLVIYEKPWAKDDERHRFENRFGYDDAVIEATPFEVIKPTDRTLTLFNSRFFHRVEESRQRRLTYSFFFAFKEDHVIMWS